jgi:PhnB protein
MNHLPKGLNTATPYLIMHNAVAAIEFYKTAFGAEELVRLPGPDGKIGHCEIKFGDSVIMLADEFPGIVAFSPKVLGGSSVSILLYVEDVDSVVKRAVEAGAKIIQPVEDKFYGDRAGTLMDPFGHQWNIATHKEDVSPEEMQKRSVAMYEEYTRLVAQAG